MAVIMRLASLRPHGIILLLGSSCLLSMLVTPHLADAARAEVTDAFLVPDDLYRVVPFPISNTNTIVNGENAQTGEFPWYAVFAGGVLCGGALVHEDIVVTAAHCIDGSVPPSLRIGATQNNDGTLVDVKDSVMHPNYQARELENDIAILVLEESVSIQVAEFNTNDNLPPGGSTVTAMGFGRTEPDQGGGSNTLQKLEMEALSDAECLATFPDYNSGQNICVDENNAGICFGDSGSPLVNDNNLVLGVASFVIQSCDSRFPDFFTRISSYSTWLQRSICEESANPPQDGTCENVGDDDGPGGGGGGGDGFFDFIIECLNTVVELCTDLLG